MYPLSLCGEQLEVVEKFMFLGSCVSVGGGVRFDQFPHDKSRIGLRLTEPSFAKSRCKSSCK